MSIERSLVGTLILSPPMIPLTAGLRPEWFGSKTWETAFVAIRHLGDATEVETVVDEILVLGIHIPPKEYGSWAEALYDAMDHACCDPTVVREYAKRIKEHYVARRSEARR